MRKPCGVHRGEERVEGVALLGEDAVEAVEREHPRDVGLERGGEVRQHCRRTPHGSWKNEEAQKGAVDEPAGARDAEVDAGLAALDEQWSELHAIARDMLDDDAGTTFRLHERAAGRRIDGRARGAHAPHGGLTRS